MCALHADMTGQPVCRAAVWESLVDKRNISETFAMCWVQIGAMLTLASGLGCMLAAAFVIAPAHIMQ